MGGSRSSNTNCVSYVPGSDGPDPDDYNPGGCGGGGSGGGSSDSGGYNNGGNRSLADNLNDYWNDIGGGGAAVYRETLQSAFVVIGNPPGSSHKASIDPVRTMCRIARPCPEERHYGPHQQSAL